MCDRLRPAAAALALLGALLVPAAAARAEDSADKVKVEARVVPAEGTPTGGTARIEVTLAIEETWHLYGPGDVQETTLAVESGAEGLEVGPFKPTSKPKSHLEPGDTEPRNVFEGTVSWAADVKIPPGTKAGERILAGHALVEACDPSMCLAPGKAPFRATLRILAGGAAAPPAPPAPAAAGTPEVADRGISLGFLLQAVIAGLLTIATPCVFPMIPLTVSLLTKRAEKEPGRIVSSAMAYGAGMFVSLAGIGLAMSLLLGVAPTDFALSPWFNAALFAFLLYLAFSLFGAYDITLPAFLTDWAQGKTGAGGGTGLFFMGMTLAFTSFACAAPFAGVLVVQARTEVVKGVVGMSVYAGTFTLPFFVTALFPGLLRRLPRSGGWLNAVKVVMGFVEVAAAFKFLRAADMVWDWGFFSFELVLAVWIACCLGAFLYLLGFILLPHDTKLESVGVGRLCWALLFLSCGIFLVPGLFGRNLPAFVESFIIREDEGKEWIRNDLDYALHEAKEHGKPVFVDFTGFG